MYTAPNTRDKARTVLHSVLKKSMGIDLKIKRSLQQDVKETVSYEHLCEVINHWRDYGNPDLTGPI